MIKVIYKTLKYMIASLLSVILLLLLAATILYYSANRDIPNVIIPENIPLVKEMNGYTQFDSSVLKLNDHGLWELHLKGDPSERGLAFGQLCKSLMYEQEKAFVNEIRKIIPSKSYLNFLKYLTIIYNRNITKNIPEEFLKEIYASSLACSEDFDFIGNAYERQLNYHAAHDLGHAMQEYMLVGCSSFGVWGEYSQNGSLLIGRNFDFYVGEDFAKNKIISFYYPETGYKFASIGWAGMVGVLSGMNEKGLTVTINAAKSDAPIFSKTPISIITRQILQYASNVEEAFNIAKEMDAFVSESILVGSSKDGIAVIIEKTPTSTILYKSDSNKIISTNHFQSSEFRDKNKDYFSQPELMEGHSLYRFNRLEQLLGELKPLTPIKAAGILRDPYGIDGKDIGLTNEKSLNQFISHHAVIFEPEKLLMWVSTSPWQLGDMIAYDLNILFKTVSFEEPLDVFTELIPEDSILMDKVYSNVIKFKEMEKVFSEAIQHHKTLDKAFIDQFIETNPHYYYTFQLVGDYFLSIGKQSESIKMYQDALTKELPSFQAKNELIEKIKKLK